MLYNDIGLFVSVAQTLNYSRTAEELNISASRVSRRLADLEDKLGYKLFERTTRSVRLTEEGRQLLDRCQMPIELLREVGGNVIEDTPSTIKITAPALAARTTIGPKLLNFAEQNPSLTIEMHASNTNFDFIRDNIELAFRVGPIEDESLIAKPLWEVPYTFCVGQELYKKRNLSTEISLQELLCLPALMFAPSWLVEEGNKLIPRRIAHRLSELELVLDAVERNMGVALLPSDMLSGRNVKAINVSGAKPTKRIMHAVYPSRRLLPSRVRKLIDFMLDS